MNAGPIGASNPPTTTPGAVLSPEQKKEAQLKTEFAKLKLPDDAKLTDLSFDASNAILYKGKVIASGDTQMGRAGTQKATNFPAIREAKGKPVGSKEKTTVRPTDSFSSAKPTDKSERKEKSKALEALIKDDKNLYLAEDATKYGLYPITASKDLTDKLGKGGKISVTSVSSIPFYGDHITVTVTDASGASASRSFKVDPKRQYQLNANDSNSQVPLEDAVNSRYSQRRISIG